MENITKLCVLSNEKHPIIRDSLTIHFFNFIYAYKCYDVCFVHNGEIKDHKIVVNDTVFR